MNNLLQIIQDDFFNFPAISSMHPLFNSNSDLFVKPASMPSPDIVDFKDYLQINIPLAGYSKDKVSVTVEDGTLSVVADKSELYSGEDKPNYFYKRSLSLGGFKWRLKLNSVIDTDEVSAELKDGILFITLPKKAKVVKQVQLKS